MTQEPPHLLASAGAHESTTAAGRSGRSLYVRGQQARIIGNGRDDLEEETINQALIAAQPIDTKSEHRALKTRYWQPFPPGSKK